MGKMIMVVDDEPHIVAVLKLTLESEGFEVIEASGGHEALEKLGKDPLPDLMLIDMFMPKMSGRQLCERIRSDERLKDIKVIFVTVAQFADTGKDMLEKMRVSDYIQKPFNNTDLVERVKKVLG